MTRPGLDVDALLEHEPATIADGRRQWQPSVEAEADWGVLRCPTIGRHRAPPRAAQEDPGIMTALRPAIGIGVVVVVVGLAAGWYSLRPVRAPFQPVSVSDVSGDVHSNPRGAEAPAGVDLLEVTLTDVGQELHVEFRHTGEGPEPRPAADSDQSMLGYTLTLWDPQGRGRVLTAVARSSPRFAGWDAPSEPTVYVCPHDGSCPLEQLDALGSIDLGPDTGRIIVPWEALGGAPPEGFQWVLTSHWTIRGSEFRNWVDEVPNTGTLPTWNDATEGSDAADATHPSQPPAGATTIGP